MHSREPWEGFLRLLQLPTGHELTLWEILRDAVLHFTPTSSPSKSFIDSFPEPLIGRWPLGPDLMAGTIMLSLHHDAVCSRRSTGAINKCRCTGTKLCRCWHLAITPKLHRPNESLRTLQVASAMAPSAVSPHSSKLVRQRCIQLRHRERLQWRLWK